MRSNNRSGRRRRMDCFVPLAMTSQKRKSRRTRVLRLSFWRPLRGRRNSAVARKSQQQSELRILIAVVVHQVVHVAVAPAATVLAILAALAEARTIFAEAATAPTMTALAMSVLAAPIAIEIAAFAPLAAVEALPMRPQHPRQHGEAGFLGVVEALIERRAGVGDLLERDAALAHGVGALRQPVERRRRSLSLILRRRRLAGF